MVYRVAMNLEVLYGATSAVASWPSTLPSKFLINGFSITPKSTAIRSDNDSGPSYQRPRFTTQMDIMVGSMAMDDTQILAFWTFYNTTLVRGALQFSMVHPVSGVTVTMQFDVSQPPQITSIFV